MGWEDMCPLPQCWPEPLDAAEIGAAVLELIILRVQALCLSDKQRRWCYFLHWGKSYTSGWKWILRSASCQNDVCQLCLCWNLWNDWGQCCCWKRWPLPLVIHSSRDCLMFCSFYFSVETSALAFIPFLEKYTKSEDVIRSSCLQPCTYMGGESMSTSVWLLLFSNWHWLIDPKITGELRDRQVKVQTDHCHKFSLFSIWDLQYHLLAERALS